MPKKYWALLDIQQETLIDGFKITLTTNTPCHLFMRWTTVVPQQHSIPVYRRGIAMHADKYFCFDVYKDNEQEEPGDTITHTFIKTNWPVCETRYFYFHGTIDGEPSPSTTAIFRKHFKGVTMIGPFYLVVTDYHWTKWLRRYVSGQSYAQCHDADDATLIPSSSSRMIQQWKYAVNKYYIGRKPLYFDTSAIPDNAVVMSAILHQKASYIAGHIEDIYLFNAPDLHDPPVLADYGYIRDLTTDPVAILAEADVRNTYSNFWYLNKLGCDNISKTGYTKLAMRLKGDVDRVEPTTYNRLYLDENPSYLHIAYYTI